MNFSEIFIRRPVLSTVVALMILLVGAQGILNMAIRQYPKVEETVITVTTTYAGASPDLIQGFITTPVAKAVSSAEGVDYVTSSSRQSASQVQVHMRLNTDPNAALTEVISKVQQVRGQLPSEADDPVIVKGTGQQFALMYLAVQSEVMNAREITEFITRVIQPRLATVEGVADAQILGGQEFAMRVWIDPVRLASRGATATDVLTAIRNANFLSAPGSTKNQYVAYAIETETTLQTPEAFGALPIRSDGDEVVRLRDVADVELGAENEETHVRFNGLQGVFLGVYPTPAANPLDVASAVRTALPAVQETLPEGTRIELVYDSTVAISASIEEVFKTIGEAVAIVILVILLFLGSFRSVVIPIVTIPLSLVGVCFFLYGLDYSLNTLTLLAMVLAIGLVVDDAIVVVENIHRHIEEGLKPLDAAIVGMREIFGPVVAMTITLAAVYAPIGFTQGLTGSLFREFAFTLAGAVILSGFVAVTLSPMMSARLLKSGHQGGFAGFVDRTFDGLAGWYGRRLDGSLSFRPVTLLVVAVLLATTGFLFVNTTTELAPEEDQGALFSVVNAPAYATSEYTAYYADQIDEQTKSIPELAARFQVVGGDSATSGFVGFVMKPWAERERSQQQIQPDLQAIVGKSTGLQGFVFSIPSLPGSGGGLPVQVVVQSTADAARVYEVAEEIKKRAMGAGRFIVVQDSLSFETPQVRVLIDRDRAAALGVSIADIGNTLNILVGESSVSKFDRDARAYDIIPQVRRSDRMNPESLGAFFVRSQSGEMVPLSSVVSVTTQASAPAIEQFNQLNSATISALPQPGVTTGDALATIQQIAREVMPDGYFLEYAGQSRLELEAGNTLLIAFGLAVLVIYLVLAAQFESFRDPFIIMMSVPLSIFGAIVPLNIGLGTLNIYTQVGLITLVGLITKHGILMVEFANGLRETRGLGKREAIVEAAKVRLRPILMTTAAMVLGVIPLITADGAGAAARYSIGLVIATGMSVGTLFTLFVVPMFYTLLSHADHAVGEDTAAHASNGHGTALPHPAE
ncbi:efflux RND transporter permease subunit [Oharaeibacter diazotrophicus]|uniref:Multidrug efflux pump n=1 Tax=Oharaeibacter diazotrophicus TaxID=1920512 RepID=A0A4R6RFX0_9HYPH|nr:efflux RND transporter permease subunit [Oharaeibacter diazotrophicus]TDP85213.1 multidrug efflux pump [Oharaeibacter diazotrophicus]BBE74183.1 multidrug resistance protein MexB [Pleomorphomonas sp. SM30]GLS76129.1 acriflavine resistance protein B [Oharaeibacter diazotrophicus]